MRDYGAYLLENAKRTGKLGGRVNMALGALVPAILAATVLGVAWIDRPPDKGSLSAARTILSEQLGDVLFVLLVGVAVTFLLAALVFSPMSMWVEHRRRLRALETPNVVLDRASVGPIKLSFSNGRASQIVGPLRLSVSAAGPVRIERILAAPHVMFHRKHGGGTNPALSAVPFSDQPPQSGYDWGYSWNVGVQDWELDGLPTTIQPGTELVLPLIMVEIRDTAEAKRLIAESENTALEVAMTVRTSVGTFPIEADKPIVATTPSTPDGVRDEGSSSVGS
jgi:hypothetical protein